jgi:hypothetical protein
VAAYLRGVMAAQLAKLMSSSAMANEYENLIAGGIGAVMWHLSVRNSRAAAYRGNGIA